jgi:hypothetical protein
MKIDVTVLLLGILASTLFFKHTISKQKNIQAIHFITIVLYKIPDLYAMSNTNVR